MAGSDGSLVATLGGPTMFARIRLLVAASEAGLLKQSASKSLKLDSLISIISARDPDIFDGKTWPMFSAAWPEWDYAWTHAKPAAALDDGQPGG
jgi:hypothetical protein